MGGGEGEEGEKEDKEESPKPSKGDFFRYFFHNGFYYLLLVLYSSFASSTCKEFEEYMEFKTILWDDKTIVLYSFHSLNLQKLNKLICDFNFFLRD